MAHMSQDGRAPIKSAETTFEIVETLVEMDGAGVSELAEQLDKPISTVYDHLQTLLNRRYVVKTGETYHVGTRFLEIGEFARNRMKIYEVAKPEVQELAEKTNEHANIMVEEHGLGVFLYKAEGDNAVELDTLPGMRVPLQTTSLGKSIMAHLPEERVHEILDRQGMPQITENTITDRDELFDELETIRERDYALDHEERIEGMRCVAAPIKVDDVLGAVSVSGPTHRLNGDRFQEEIPNMVLRTANVIEVNLKYS